MTIYCFGSINIDRIYHVPEIPAPGETLRACGVDVGLGGKGANTSVALARAGARVVHIGAVSQDAADDWVLEQMAASGIGLCHVARLDLPTGHAIVQVAESGENAITIFPGANEALTADMIDAGLAGAGPGDWLVLQNETNGGEGAARTARALGLKVGYVAAPFDVEAVTAMLPFVDLIAMNAGEAAAFETRLGRSVSSADLPDILVTHGAEGAVYHGRDQSRVSHPAVRVDTVVDTTCAGDTYFGYFVQAIAAGEPLSHAMAIASAAAAISVTRKGASRSIPTLDEVRSAMGRKGPR